MVRSPGVKLLPPVLPPGVVARPRLDAFLAEVTTRRLSCVVAPAGFGKSTLLAAWAESRRTAWYALTPDDTDVDTLFRGVVAALRLRVPDLGHALSEATVPAVRGPDAQAERDERARAHAAVLALALEDLVPARGDLVLVLDDVHELSPETPPARFVEAFCRQAPAGVHVVALSRTDLPFPTARLRSRGECGELTGSTMAFLPEETALMVRGIVGRDAGAVAQRLHEATRGWPAAVRLGSEAIREREWSDREATDVIGSDATYAHLAEEVLGLLDAEVVDLVRAVAPLEAFTVDLCAVLGVRRPVSTLEALERRGLFLVPHGGDGWYSLHPLLRDFALVRLATGPAEVNRTRSTAADWFERSGQPLPALRYRMAAGDVPAVAVTLERHGAAIIGAGGATDVVRAAGLTERAGRSPAIDQVEGEARHALGDWDGALVCFRRLRSADGLLPAGAAWRSGLIHYQRGDLEDAVACYAAVAPGPLDDPDHVMVLAWSAAVQWLRGDRDGCRKLASEAMAAATVSGDDRALAASHTALGMLAALDGDLRGNDAHYLQALVHAERCGDVMQLIRVRSNRGSRLVEEGYYREAVAELDAALRAADLAGYGAWRAMVLTNRGQALLELGRLDEAARDLDAALLYFRRVTAPFAAYPLVALGDVHRLRGELSLARSCYETGLELGEATLNLQAVVPALTGLARLALDDDPAAARALAGRAVSAGAALGRSSALLAQGLAALRCGERSAATRCAEEAAALARKHRDRAGSAGAVELRALAADDAGEARLGLADAASMWRQLENPIALAGAELALARLDAGPEAVRTAVAATARLRAAGARRRAEEAASYVAERTGGPAHDLGVQVLGGFRVARSGVPIGPSAWGSRKPRDLLKVLVAERGRPVPRDLLLERLWPEDPRGSGRRLSVALSTLRSLLDPAKAFAPQHFVAADRSMVRLATEHCVVDLEAFLAAAAAALSAADARAPEATEMLALAESAYTGDPFVEDAYEDWARPVRDATRATYASVVRALAERRAAAGDHDQAVRHWLRVLDGDPYDEGAHLGLVESLRADRRHGEARRAYRAYCDRMEQIDVEPEPYP